MRLFPPITEEKALSWLKETAAFVWGLEVTEEVEGRLKGLAADMAAVSAAVFPEEVEPLFPGTSYPSRTQ